MKKPFFSGVYFITDRNLSKSGDVISDIKNMCEGGAQIIQLREKNLSKTDFLETAIEARKITKKYGTKLIINDSVFIAKESGADGVHLGQNDENPILAREILGENAIIGLSVQTLEMLETAKKYPLNYIGCGAVFPTNTHKTTSLLGIDGLKKLHEHSPFPVVAIGGIHENTFDAVVKSRVESVAMVSEIVQNQDVQKISRAYLMRFKSLREKM